MNISRNSFEILWFIFIIITENKFITYKYYSYENICICQKNNGITEKAYETIVFIKPNLGYRYLCKHFQEYTSTQSGVSKWETSP